ncbi:hypothetical protein [Myroides phaeus]|uniref:hypothetical protein n=1 Tax=Myroides phaeus TaxID=702745 RepID=UPI001303A221|nr:hypothetical protein [Myroides phaeus]
MIYLLKKEEEDTLDVIFNQVDIKNKLLSSYGQPLFFNWNVANCKWYKDEESEDSKEKDFILLLGYIPICKSKIIDAFMKEFSSEDIEYLPILIEDKSYYVLNILKKYDHLVNIAKSRVDYFSDKSIMWIHEFVFYPRAEVSLMFRVSEISSVVFVNEHFKNIYDDNNFKGLDFKKCRIKKRSILNLLFK